MSQSRCMWLSIVVMSLALAGSADAQEREVIRFANRIGSLESQVVARLSFTRLDIAPHVLARVFRLNDGGWGVSSTTFDGVVQTFDPMGNPEHSFGRRGAGPGEFAGEVFGIGDAAALWIIDPGNARMSAFSRDLTLLHDRTLPGKVFFVSRSDDDGAVLVTGLFPGPDRGYTIARVSRDQERDVFGGRADSNPNTRVLVHIPVQVAGEVWTFAVSGGAVNILRSSDLTGAAGLRFAEESMTRIAEEGRRNPSEPPPSQVAGVSADGPYVWLTVGVADKDWRPGMSPRDGVHRLFDTRVIVIDVRTRTVIGQGRLPELCLPVDHRLISCVDELGEEIRIIELNLKPVH